MLGLVEEPGGREVVGGQHRDPDAVRVQLRDVDDGEAARGPRAGSSALGSGKPWSCDGSGGGRIARASSAGEELIDPAGSPATSRLGRIGSLPREPSGV